MNQSINQLNEEFVLRLCNPSTRQQWLDSGVHYLCQQIESTYAAWGCVNWEDNISDKLGYQLNYPNTTIADNIKIRICLICSKFIPATILTYSDTMLRCTRPIFGTSNISFVSCRA